jgi:formylglycine-generating enzyme required for sulfatase activity/serine/threonine protein kinase
MQTPFAILRVLCRALLDAVGGVVAGNLVIDALPDVARDVWTWWSKERSPEQRRAELEAMALAPAAAVEEAVRQAVAEVAGGRPAEVQEFLVRFLAHVPVAVRQSLRRPGDGAGPATSPFVEGPNDVLTLLPSHLPRFRPGDRPLPSIDWELVELLGAGGFGEVWKARNPHFDGVPPVALKFCLDPTARDRLLRHEAAVLNQIMRQGKHPGIVALQHTFLGADPPCLEYEYVAGGDLAGSLHEMRHEPAGPARAEWAAHLMLDLSHIVAFAHGLSPPVVHRDLKPANILVQHGPDGRERLRVADFGIGGVAANHMIARSRLGTSPGGFLVTALRGAHTPLYASPQQMRGDPPDVRDDVHALGVIWYQLATGNLMAGRPGGTRWAQKLADLGLSFPMIELLGACVEEDPNDRPADAGVLAERLAALIVPAAEATARCPDCGGPMRRRDGKYGAFLGCVAYPHCKGSRELPGGREKPRENRSPVPADLPKTVTNSAGIRLVLVPAGTFLMGSPESEAERGTDEGPRHQVTLSRPLYVGVFPVTQAEYENVTGTNPAQFRKGAGGGPRHPVEQVSWDEAVAFCRRLSELPAEKAAKRVYRLPTEAEWEYACRAGTTTAFSCGESLSGEQANFDSTRPAGAAKRKPAAEKTTKVGAYRANAWGLCDMHGNVWEWCADRYGEDHYREVAEADPTGPARGGTRVLRGGSWNSSGHMCRGARRHKYAPNFKGDTIGFRVVLVV